MDFFFGDCGVSIDNFRWLDTSERAVGDFKTHVDFCNSKALPRPKPGAAISFAPLPLRPLRLPLLLSWPAKPKSSPAR